MNAAEKDNTVATKNERGLKGRVAQISRAAAKQL
jgi:hypothetical protein